MPWINPPAAARCLSVAALVALVLGASPAPAQTSGTGAGSTSNRSRPSLSERRGITVPGSESKTNPTPAPSADPAKPEPKKDGFLGDTSRFTRFSGWGSMGAAMGQFGVARSMLVMMPPVQKELKLTDKQKGELVKVGEETRKRGEKMGEAMRKQGGDPFGGGNNGNGEETSIVARIGQFNTMMSRVSDLMRENEDGLAQVLSVPQRKRLDQIALQMEGVMALTRPEVAEALGLFPIEQEEIAQIIARARMTQMTAMVGTMISMRNNRDRSPNADRAQDRKTRDTSAAADRAKPIDGKEGDKPTKEARSGDPETRAQREKAMRERFGALRDGNDRVQEQAVKEILKFLNKSQRARFTQMLGPPFDPAQVNELGRPGQRPGAPDREKLSDREKPADG